jgi:hypothetical protein
LKIFRPHRPEANLAKTGSFLSFFQASNFLSLQTAVYYFNESPSPEQEGLGEARAGYFERRGFFPARKNRSRSSLRSPSPFGRGTMPAALRRAFSVPSPRPASGNKYQLVAHTDFSPLIPRPGIYFLAPLSFSLRSRNHARCAAEGFLSTQPSP